MKLKMTINKIKSVDNLTIELPVDKGLYALTGQNGAGKSTVATCASSVFFNMTMKDYFGETPADSKIEFEYNGAKKTYHKEYGKWTSRKYGHIELKGFYEGSLIFGNRFRNTSFNNLRKLDGIDSTYLKSASEFIRENLGLILHNNKNFYQNLFSVNPGAISVSTPFFRQFLLEDFHKTVAGNHNRPSKL